MHWPAGETGRGPGAWGLWPGDCTWDLGPAPGAWGLCPAWGLYLGSGACAWSPEPGVWGLHPAPGPGWVGKGPQVLFKAGAQK